MTGVTFDIKNHTFRSRIRIHNCQKEERFSVSKFGFDVAKQLAIDWRLKMAQETDNFVSKPHESMTPRHPDYDRLKSEFEEIMLKHAQGWKWKDA